MRRYLPSVLEILSRAIDKSTGLCNRSRVPIPCRSSRYSTIPAAATTAFLLHRKSAYLPHHLKASPANSSGAHCPLGSKWTEADNHRPDLLQNFSELPMPGKFQNCPDTPNQLTLFLSHRRAPNKSLTESIATLSEIKSQKPKTPATCVIHDPCLLVIDFNVDLL